jgi:hypothetical protein
MTELSARKLLTAYLLSRRLHGVDEWYGVTAYSLADARAKRTWFARSSGLLPSYLRSSR